MGREDGIIRKMGGGDGKEKKNVGKKKIVKKNDRK